MSQQLASVVEASSGIEDVHSKVQHDDALVRQLEESIQRTRDCIAASLSVASALEYDVERVAYLLPPDTLVGSVAASACDRTTPTTGSEMTWSVFRRVVAAGVLV